MTLHRFNTCLAVLLLGAASTALAQDAPNVRGDEPMMHGPVKQSSEAIHQALGNSPLIGEHNMPGTVTQVDHRSGIVELTSLGMNLRVHFPPATIEHLKPGDHILLHLGYRMTH